MPSSQIERKLAAIMFTDIAGYTALSAKDENKALALLDTQKHILTPIIEEFNGTLHKEMGDGLLFTFPTVTDAVKCGIKIQEATKANDDLNLRVGIHEGEITLKDGDALGDDVNVASRIEAFAPSGGIAISSKVQQNISSLPEFETSYVGKPELKGVAQEVQVYCITSHGLPKTDISKVSAKLEDKSRFNIFALTGGILTAIGVAFWIAIGVFDVSFGGKAEVPSVGILMMENRGDEEDEFWARGITEDLIVKIAGAGLIRVAPMEEIIRINDLNLTIKEKAKALDVKFLLTSSLHKNDSEFDLRCQLIDVESGNSNYANKWSESLNNAPTIVGNLAENILNALKISTAQEITKVPTTNTQAYEFYLKGKYKYDKGENLEDMEISRGFFRKAIELDENLIDAQILLGWSYAFHGDAEQGKDILEKALKQAESISDKNGISSSLLHLGGTYEIKGDIVNALVYYEMSVTIGKELGNKNLVAFGLIAIGVGYHMDGDYDEAFNYFAQSLENYKQLQDKLGISHSLINLALTYMNIGDFDKSLDCLNECLEIREKVGGKRRITTALRFLGNLYVKIGDFETGMHYCMKSLKLGTEIGNKWSNGWNLTNIGKIHYYKSDFLRATQTFKKAVDIWRELENISNEIIYLSWMVLSDLRLSTNNQQEKLNLISKLLYKNEISRVSIPELNWNLYQINIEVNNEKNAIEHLEIAYKEVIRQADNFQSSKDRKSFLTNVRTNREIVEEWEKVK